MAAEPRNKASLYRSSSEIILATCSGGARACDGDLEGCGSGVDRLVNCQNAASRSKSNKSANLLGRCFNDSRVQLTLGAEKEWKAEDSSCDDKATSRLLELPGWDVVPRWRLPGQVRRYVHAAYARPDRPYLIIAAGGSAASLFKRQTQLDHIPLFYYCLVGLQLQSAPSNLPPPRRFSAGL